MPLSLDVTARLALLLLSAASVYAFWVRFRLVVGIIRSARPDPSFQLEPLARRVRDFVWEVMLQGKVIRERPWPGLAHAFVFWGFCAFALVTVSHFGEGFGFSLLLRHGAFGRFYFWLAAVFAVAVAVSIAALAFRRFVLRPRWLGKLSPESGIIAALIFALMATYLATFRLDEHGAAWKTNWWLHTLALLVFLPLIPHTKHLHLILSPLAVFLSRGGFSAIPPLEGDEDFGLASGKDATRLVALQVFSCVECGRCSEHCPASHTGKLLDPKEIALGVRGYLKEFGPGGETPIIGRHVAEEAVFQCTTCGACEYQCPVGIEHVPIIVGLRRGVVNTGRWEDDRGARLFLNLERSGNPLGFSSAERDKFVARESLPFYDGTQEYCLWLGCMGAYDPQGREIVASFARVLRHLGISFGVLRKERCTGDSARRLGNDLAFSQLAEQNLEIIRAHKVSKLVSICPHCVRTLSEDYKEFGADLVVEHHSELLARLRDRLPAVPPGNGGAGRGGSRIVYHDPCYLGRYRGVYDAPREVVARFGSEVDPARTRQRSFCCGAGGGLVFLGEEKGRRVSVERAGQLAATGAEIVAAACPFCATMFRDALAGLSATPPGLLDIAQLAAAAIDLQAEGGAGRPGRPSV